MNTKKLFCPRDLNSTVGELFNRHGNAAQLEVYEDIGFAAQEWLGLGHIELQPGEAGFEHAVTQGAYRWIEPNAATIEASLEKVLPKGSGKEDSYKRGLDRILDGIEFAKQRLGFLSPLWDAYRFSEFPYRRPVTIVADTTGVQQGALDFVARFLTPCARIKIPAVVQMEVLLRADNYFKARGKKKSGPSTVVDHVLSQGGQRTLLRLEGDPELEIERAHLVDPLRGIIFPASDAEDKALGLQDVHRSFADRLIFESARQHRSEANHGHPTYLLTSDQGLARMSTAEGLTALFFQSPKARHGRVLSGVQAHPFEKRLIPIPLLAVLWEFAVCFGAARLRFDAHISVEVGAMGGDAPWQPFHCQDDLLWVQINGAEKNLGRQSQVSQEIIRTVNSQDAGGTPTVSPVSSASSGTYRIYPAKLIKIAEYFRSHSHLEDLSFSHAMGLSIGDSLNEVRRFLEAGEFVSGDQRRQRTGRMTDLVEALDRKDHSRAIELLSKIPSFDDLLQTLKDRKCLKEKDVNTRAYESYGALAEVFGLALRIPDQGIHWAGNNPRPSDFASAAIKAYRTLSPNGEEFVLTGAWLEELVLSFNIHPLAAKMRLEEARTAGLLNRYFEGSTPETSYERHRMQFLSNTGGKLQIVKVGLYRGDFLSEHRQSVSIRIEEGDAK